MKRNITFKQLLVFMSVFFLATPLMQAQEKSWVKEYLSYYDSIQNFRYYDQRGVNVFESPKNDVKFEGLRVRFGAGFTQQFQSLKHENYVSGLANPGTADAANKLYSLGAGFNTAQANLNMDVQLADGIRLNLVTYLSARHHNEAWVKGGYIQFDKVPFKGKFWDDLMDIVTIKIGHMEINYGDAHFRRSDGGQTIYNPFIENYIMDAFTTEIGGEVYAQYKGLFGMLGVSNGEIKGNVEQGTPLPTDPDPKKSPAIYLKGGYDKQLTEKTRIRVSGSFYTDKSSASNTLFWGDRTGSNYFMVMEKTGTNPTAQAWSGRVNPTMGDRTQGIMLNGFVKFGGLELFGTWEQAKGRGRTETEDRSLNQLAGDVIYRIGKKENLFLGARYNTLNGDLRFGTTNKDVSVDRFAFAGGWFITQNVMLKAEYVTQNYNDYPSATQYTNGKFKGVVVEAVVGF